HTLIVHLLVAAYIVFRATQRAAPAESEHQEFVDSMVAAGTLSQVYEEELQPDVRQPRDPR
ncbi:MAG: hypothetical protein KJO82_07795, partial [Gammaproteobacteria bacterium]|nr:hypothetical protein [Gammaproteobacteria bacterium]